MFVETGVSGTLFHGASIPHSCFLLSCISCKIFILCPFIYGSELPRRLLLGHQISQRRPVQTFFMLLLIITGTRHNPHSWNHEHQPHLLMQSMLELEGTFFF